MCVCMRGTEERERERFRIHVPTNFIGQKIIFWNLHLFVFIFTWVTPPTINN
jgi:hypothetical protein